MLLKPNDFHKILKIIKERNSYVSISIGSEESYVNFETSFKYISSFGDDDNGNYSIVIHNGVQNVSLYNIEFRVTPKTIIVGGENHYTLINTENDKVKTYLEIEIND